MRNIHPILVHFPIALFFAAMIFDLIGTWRKKEILRDTAARNLWAALLFSLLAAASGLWAERGVPHTGEAYAIATTHKWLSFGFIGIAAVLCSLRWKRKEEVHTKLRNLYFGLYLGGALLLGVGAHWGGRLVYEHGIGTSVVYSDYVKSEGGHAEKNYKQLMAEGRCIVMPKEKVDPNFSCEYEGVIYQFCCPMCLQFFQQDPKKYLR